MVRIRPLMSCSSRQWGPTWLAGSWVSMACSLSAGVVAGVSSTSLLLVGVTGGQRSGGCALPEAILAALPGLCIGRRNYWYM